MLFNKIAVSRRGPAPVAGILIAVLAGIAGCGDKATNPTQAVPLTLEARGIGGASQHFTPGTIAVSPAASTVSADVSVTYTTALLVVRDVRFVLSNPMDGEGGGATDSLGMGESAGAFDDDDDAGQVRFHGPFVIDLLSGQAERLDTQMVMPGDYRRVQGHLRSLRSGDEDASAHAGLVGYTVLLEGTIDGEGGGDFSYLARIDNEFQIRGSFTVEAETPATAFVAFDLSTWLTNRDGQFLDPRDGENDQAIKSAIRHSIKVGMDDDHDGEMDDQEMSGDGGA